MGEQRREMGDAAERIAATMLDRHGLVIEQRNVSVGRGEVDLIARDGAVRVIVEVRSRRSESAPIEALDHAKQRQLRQLSRELGVSRVDLVAVGFGLRFVDVHWIPNALGVGALGVGEERVYRGSRWD